MIGIEAISTPDAFTLLRPHDRPLAKHRALRLNGLGGIVTA